MPEAVPAGWDRHSWVLWFVARPAPVLAHSGLTYGAPQALQQAELGELLQRCCQLLCRLLVTVAELKAGEACEGQEGAEVGCGQLLAAVAEVLQAWELRQVGRHAAQSLPGGGIHLAAGDVAGAC